jgi:uncharacterized protein (UPF0303 family)
MVCYKPKLENQRHREEKFGNRSIRQQKNSCEFSSFDVQSFALGSTILFQDESFRHAKLKKL